MGTKRLLAAIAISLLASLALAVQASAYHAAAGYAVSDFATGFSDTNIGPIGLAFDASNHLYVMEYPEGILYKFGPSGGAANATTRVNAVPIEGRPAGLTFSKDGRLYAALQFGNKVIEIIPSATGITLRDVATGLDGATGIATDPLSGDLFVTSPFVHKLWRLSNFSSGTATVALYAEPTGPDGITFGPDGTIYVASNGAARKITGTDKSSPHTITKIADVSTIDGIALSAGTAGSAPSAIFGNRNDGKITRVDLTTLEQTDIVTGGTRGDFSAVGPDGCLYATQSQTVAKVTNADGSCSFAPTTVVPILRLAPPSQSLHVGSSATVTATLTNVASPNGQPITFTVTGANPRTGVVQADSSGKAVFSYAGSTTGNDSVVATTTSGEQLVTSNSVTVTWTAALPTPTATPRVLPATGSGGAPPSTTLPIGLLIGTIAFLVGIVVIRQFRKGAGWMRRPG